MGMKSMVYVAAGALIVTGGAVAGIGLNDDSPNSRSTNVKTIQVAVTHVAGSGSGADQALVDMGPVGGVSPLRDRLPLTFDRSFGRYVLAIGQAKHAWRSSCLGIPMDPRLSIPPTESEVDVFLSKMNRKRFGLPSESEAAEFGYGEAGYTGERTRSGADPAELNAMTDKLHACNEEFNRRLEAASPGALGEGGPQEFNDLQSAQADAANQAASTPEVEKARSQWRACMNRAGYHPTGGRSAVGLPPDGLGVDIREQDSTANKETAVADVRCAAETGIVPIEVNAREKSEAALLRAEGKKIGDLRSELDAESAALLEVAASYES